MRHIIDIVAFLGIWLLVSFATVEITGYKHGPMYMIAGYFIIRVINNISEACAVYYENRKKSNENN